MASIVANLTVATVGRIINTALGLASTAILARLLGSANYGVYSVLLSYGVMFQIAADYGLYLLLTQKIGQDSSAKQHAIPPIFTLRVLLLIVSFVVGVTLALFLPAINTNLPALLLILAGLTFQSISQLCMGIYQANRSVAAATAGDTVGRLAQIAGLGWLLLQSHTLTSAGSPVMTAALLFGVGTLVALAIHLKYLPDRRHFKMVFSTAALKSMVRESWPLAAILVLNTIYFRIDMLMLPIWREAAEIGLYALAYRLIENTLFFPAMVGGLLLPHLSHAFHQRQGAHAQQLVAQALRVVTTVAAITAVVFIAAPREILTFIAGHQFAPAAPLLQILTLALVVMFFGNIFGFTLVAQKQSKFLLKLYLVLVVVNILANRVAIPALGATGAALSTLLTEIIACGVAAYKITSTLSIALPASFRWSLVAYIAVSALLIYLLPSSLTGIYRLVSIGCIALALAYIIRLLRLKDIPLLAHAHPLPIPSEPYA